MLVHCAQAQSRTPTIAALYGARRHGVDIAEALGAVHAVLSHAGPISEFQGFSRNRGLYRRGMSAPDIGVVVLKRHSDAPVLTAKPAKSFESTTTWL